MSIGQILQASVAAPVLAMPSLHLPAGMELSGTMAASLTCVADRATVGGEQRTLRPDQSKFTLGFSPKTNGEGVYRDFYFHQDVPVAWKSTSNSLSFAMWVKSEEKRADVNFVSNWQEDGKITFRSTVKTTFADQNRRPIVLDRYGDCELLIDMHPEVSK